MQRRRLTSHLLSAIGNDSLWFQDWSLFPSSLSSLPEPASPALARSAAAPPLSAAGSYPRTRRSVSTEPDPAAASPVAEGVLSPEPRPDDEIDLMAFPGRHVSEDLLVQEFDRVGVKVSGHIRQQQRDELDE